MSGSPTCAVSGTSRDRRCVAIRGRSAGSARSSPKRWAAQQLPQHRGSGGSRVRGKINHVGMLSEHLHRRPDHGLDPAALGRNDLEAFLNRLAHLEFTGQIGRYRRNMICRDVRQVLAGIRSLGLTRHGQPAAGLPGDFSIESTEYSRRP
jgi:hypothetical protein